MFNSYFVTSRMMHNQTWYYHRMMRKHTKAILTTAILLIVAGGVYFYTRESHVFADANYGFKFTYPADWLITSDAYNRASHGVAFQLSNFRHADSALPDPKKGQNIVYGNITYTTLSEILGIYNDCHYGGDCDPNIFATSTTIAGHDAVVLRSKLEPEAPITGYSIFIASSNFPRAVLNIGITGDPRNFYQLQEILNSLKVTKN